MTTVLATAPQGPVARAYGLFPVPLHALAMDLRVVVFTVAARMELPDLEETIKWGEPAYLPGRGGTTLRIGYGRDATVCKLLVNCQTTLIDGWRQRFEGRLVFEGNRAVLLAPGVPFDRGAIETCVADAFVYHKRKKAAHG